LNYIVTLKSGLEVTEDTR